MNPANLLPPPDILGLPAPLWFIQFFKVLGFSLHMVPMNLWFAGILVSAALLLLKNPHARHLSDRLMNQMPIIIALGINFGIIPLLFSQAGYYRVFYPATILIAWPWFAVIPLLIFAYYGTYLYVVQLRRGRVAPWARVLGWAVALIFMAIGFIFVNGLSLMSQPGRWNEVWSAARFSGAATGLALDLHDPTILPRWMLMFGLALTTVAAYSAFDGSLWPSQADPAHQVWLSRFALLLYSLGLLWATVAGTAYLLALPPLSRSFLQGSPQFALTAITALSPGLPWLLLLLHWLRPGHRLPALAALSQFGVLLLNALSRQSLQDHEVSAFGALGSEAVHVEWIPVALFLILFLAGLAAVAWVLVKVRRAETAHPVATR
jgi:hypothetical protein